MLRTSLMLVLLGLLLTSDSIAAEINFTGIAIDADDPQEQPIVNAIYRIAASASIETTVSGIQGSEIDTSASTQHFGTAVAIDPNGRILTARHVVDPIECLYELFINSPLNSLPGQPTNNESFDCAWSCSVISANRERSTYQVYYRMTVSWTSPERTITFQHRSDRDSTAAAELLGFADDVDLALIQINRPTPSYLQTAQTLPERFSLSQSIAPEQVLRGFSHRGYFRATGRPSIEMRIGTISQYCHLDQEEERFPPTVVDCYLSMPITYGYSGGPVLDDANQLVGILVQTSLVDGRPGVNSWMVSLPHIQALYHRLVEPSNQPPPPCPYCAGQDE